MTLIDFLNARFDEDEQLAWAAQIVIGDDLSEHRIAEWWHKLEHGRVYAGHWNTVIQSGLTKGDPPFHNMAALPHIANWDPARVLKDLETKRDIVVHVSAGWPPDKEGWDSRRILLNLALPYSDHEDYLPEWKSLSTHIVHEKD